MNAPAPQLLLTPARWATWVAQRHEWNGYLWVRWPDSEAVLLFVAGRPRIHLWNGRGWEEGDHALAAVAQRLERMNPPRWGQVALPARWAAAIRELTLAEPVLPSEVVSPAAWVEWAQRTNFGGMAVLIGDHSGAWIVQDGTVRSVRFTQGAAVNGESVPSPAEGLLQIYRGRVSHELLFPAPRPDAESERSSSSSPHESPEAAEQGTPAPAHEPVAGVPAAAAAPPAADSSQPSVVPAPAEARPAPPTISPPAPAESGESAVDKARSEASRRFRGDERFLLAPTVDLAGDAVVALAAVYGPESQRVLSLLDGSRTLAEVAQSAAVPLAQVEALLGGLVERRMVFRYTSRGRAPASSK